MAEMAVPAVRVSKAGKEEAEVASAAAVAEVRTARRGLRVIQAKKEIPVCQALNLSSRSRSVSARLPSPFRGRNWLGWRRRSAADKAYFEQEIKSF